MDILEKAGKTIKMTGDLAKQAKLKMSMGDKKSRIDEIYLSIGEKVYRKFLLEGDVSDELKSECETIDKIAEEIEYLRMEILKLKNKKQCVECHIETNYDYQFCPRCGANLD